MICKYLQPVYISLQNYSTGKPTKQSILCVYFQKQPLYKETLLRYFNPFLNQSIFNHKKYVSTHYVNPLSI